MEKELPFSPACERNKEVILKVLKKYLTNGSLLEIGHGTGQHAIYFAKNLPQINWHPADVEDNNWIMKERIKQEAHDIRNIFSPITLKISEQKKLKEQCQELFQYCYTANTLHIMSKNESNLFCEEIGNLLSPKSYLFIYGPFKFNGNFTSESNQSFDYSLKQRDPLSGIRDFENIKSILENKKFVFVENIQMPANNNFLIFKKA